MTHAHGSLNNSQNGEQSSPRSLNQNTKFASNSQNQDEISFDDADASIYILAIATAKRDLFDLSESSKGHTKHKHVLNASIVTIDGIDRLSILVALDIKHEVLVRDGLSETQRWGPLHCFYVKVVGSQILAYGVAALIGALSNQDAIGITHLLTEDDRRRFSLEHGQPLPEDFHPYFTVHSLSLISRDTSIEIMKRVCQYFSDISAQFDTSGKLIEFHDFSSSSNCTKKDIEKVLNENFYQKFQVTAEFGKSQLLNKNDYEQALFKLNLAMNRPIDWKELIRKHKITF
jgi:hypothetical protein